MDYLFVDTNMLVYCSVGQSSGHEPALLKRVSEVLDRHDAVLLMPETVRREYEYRMQSQVERYEKNARDVWQYARKNLLAQPDKDRIHETVEKIVTERQVSAANAREYFGRLMKHEKTTEIPLTGAVVSRALGYGISGRRPSKGWAARERIDNQEQGFVVENDCLIIAALVDYLDAAGSTSSDRLVFCSNNTVDFADHDDLLDDWVLDRDIADEFAAFTVFYNELHLAMEQEFSSVVLSDQEKAEYEDAKSETDALLTTAEPPGIQVSCPNCGCVAQAPEPPATPVGTAVRCMDCGRDFGIRREPRTGALLIMQVPRYEVHHDVRCACGHTQNVKTYSDLEEPVERWCLKCYSKLFIDAATGAVSRQQADQPLTAEVAYQVGADGAVLVCPECDRRVRSFVSIPAGTYAICNDRSHVSRLLRASSGTG